MQNTLTIAGRQFWSYFNGPAAYIVICLVHIDVGGLFWQSFFLMDRAVARDMFVYLAWALLFAAPALTMGLLAEERRSGTLELLITMPVRESEVVVGKYLGAMGVLAVLVALTIVHPIAIATLGDLDWGPVISGYLGVLLLGGAMLAVGTMTSSWTSNQLIAFFVSLSILMFLFLVPMAFRLLMSGPVATVVEAISLMGHFESLSRGVIDTRAVLYYLTLTALGLLAAFRALESRRWS